MAKAPQVSGLILCERVRVELAPDGLCLDGLILVREYAALPAPAALTAYAVLFDGRGEGELRLTCMRLETEEDIYYHSQWIAFSKAIPTVHCMIRVASLNFPAPGRYMFTLTFDGVALTTRFLDVREVRR